MFDASLAARSGTVPGFCASPVMGTKRTGITLLRVEAAVGPLGEDQEVLEGARPRG